MKFVTERAALLAALQRASRVAARRGTMPILNNLLIAADKRGIDISASDITRQIRIAVDAQVDKPGTATCNAQLLTNFVTGLGDGLQVEAQLAADKLTVRAGRARIVLPVLPADQFPEFPSPDNGADESVKLELGGADFARLLRSVAHAQSSEETRHYLNGVYLHRRGTRELVAVATNGHCLGRTVLALTEDAPDFAGVIVPRDAIEELALLADAAGAIELSIGTTIFQATAGDVVLSTRLVDGTFPDYEHVIPPDDIKEGFETDRAALIAATKRVGVFESGEKSKSWPVKLSPLGKGLQLMAHKADTGEIVDEIEGQTTTKLPFGLNARYLVGALEALGGATVRARYADSGAPMKLTVPGDDTKLQIVMAMRV